VESLFVFIGSFVLGGLGAWVISRWGTTLGVLDRANHRSSHEGVIPKGGGIGILAAFVFSASLLGFPYSVWISVGILSLFSLYGDRREVPPKIRLCVQFVAAIILLVGVFHWQGRGWTAYLIIPFMAVFVTGTANYYNFMDGINGIAGITGVVGFGLVAAFAGLAGGYEPLLILAVCMGLACIGFLPFNIPVKARVFMGDVGSVLLGFVFAGLVVGLSRSLNDFVVLCAFMFPFYADELTTEYVRLKDKLLPEVSGQRSGVGERQRSEVGGRRSGIRGRKTEGGTCRWLADWKMRVGILATPHRRHVYQLLANEMGIAHWKVSVGYGVLQAVVGLGALAVRGYGTGGFWGFGSWVRRSADCAD
jgi:Fuc2NAc and GlcNAc transferase